MPIPQPIEALAALLKRLPGVGEKTATKYALFLATYEKTPALGEAISALPFAVVACPACRALIDGDCPYCARQSGVVCIVHRFVDLLAIERAAGKARMRYFVLGQLVSPLDGVDENHLPLAQVRDFVASVDEVVLALPPSVEGEATAMLLMRELGHPHVTQLARGLPHGGDLEYADPITLSSAFDRRVNR